MMLSKLSTNETPGEYSCSGIELGSARIRILVGHVAANQSLRTLHLSRCEIKDEDGIDIARILYTNTTLRKLELEGNILQIKTAKEFGKALRVNKTLQFLDLESNSLTGDGEDFPGIQEMLRALEENKSLLSLNLANNKLEPAIGKEIRKMLEKNHTLIDLELGFNNFDLKDVSYTFCN